MTPRSAIDALLASPLAEVLDLPEPFDARSDPHLEKACGALLHRFRAEDDVEAFSLLVDLCQDRLVEMARSLTRSLALVIDADDLVASFMARLFTDVRRDQPPVERFLGMAYTTMRFDALNQLRLYRRSQRRGADWELRAAMRKVPADPAALVDDRERLRRLSRQGLVFLTVVCQCFHGLNPRERRILYRREIEERSYDDIARSLGLPRSQVGMILKRARERLARRIEATFRTARRHGVAVPPAPPGTESTP